jgi:transposase
MLDYREIYQKEHLENGLTYSQIREKYNIPRGTWDYWVRQKLNLRSDKRKHRANDTFF